MGVLITFFPFLSSTREIINHKFPIMAMNDAWNHSASYTVSDYRGMATIEIECSLCVCVHSQDEPVTQNNYQVLTL